MPLVTCPKCPTTLRIPDGATGNVKCPKCNTIFPVAAKPTAAAAFEVVEEPPKPAPAPKSSASKSKPAVEPDFEVLDEPKPKKKVAAAVELDDDDDRPRKKKRDDDDDDDRPRSKRRRDDDDDDRPRSKRRRDDDDDDDDDRSRKKKRNRVEDEDDDWQPAGRGGAAFANARVGVLLLSISFWLYFALYVVITFGILLIWVGVGSGSDSPRPRPGSSGVEDSGSSFEWVAVVIGLIGLGNWIVAAVGFGFCIAGPKKCRPTAITATALAGAHLVLTGVCYSMVSGSLSGLARFGGGVGSIQWIMVSTTIPFLNAFLPTIVYGSRAINGEFIVVILTGVCEVMRLIFAILTLRALATEARDHESAERAQLGVLVTSIIVGGAAILVLFVVLLLVEGKFGSIGTIKTLGLGTLFLVFIAYSVMLALPAIVAGSIQRALGRKSR